MAQVKPMKKVHVSVSLRDNKNVTEDSVVSFAFIFGIGQDGLTPFECVLEGGRKGDQIQTDVSSSSLVEYFGVLLHTLNPLTEGKILPQNLCLKIEILDVMDVENREVVAALAGSTSGCGSGGSCGCGC
ncbi:hypothetical protein [Desulforhopalus sp. 52FAK]